MSDLSDASDIAVGPAAPTNVLAPAAEGGAATEAGVRDRLLEHVTVTLAVARQSAREQEDGNRDKRGRAGAKLQVKFVNF